MTLGQRAGREPQPRDMRHTVPSCRVWVTFRLVDAVILATRADPPRWIGRLFGAKCNRAMEALESMRGFGTPLSPGRQ